MITLRKAGLVRGYIKLTDKGDAVLKSLTRTQLLFYTITAKIRRIYPSDLDSLQTGSTLYMKF